jgi:exopolysaccharide production protein ExoZ
MSVSRQFFPGIHALRAVAATLVVIQHAGFAAKDYFVFGYDIDNDYFIWGRIGVILFFAISGFVIALQRTKPVKQFVTHRLLRIYPSYWLAMGLAAILLAVCGQAVSVGPASVLLYPSSASEGTLSIPYWTLAFEMTFYALAAIAFAWRLRDRTLTIIALLWIITSNWFAPAPIGDYGADIVAYSFPGFPNILWSAAVQVFPMGLICGIHFERLTRIGRWPYLLASVIAFACGIPLVELSAAKLALHGISSCCLILAVANLDIRPRIVETLGNASYGIYLIHFPAMMAAAAISPSHGIFWFLAVGMASGTLYGLFDHWLYRRMSGQITKPLQPMEFRK